MKDIHGNGIKPINKFHLCIHQRNPQPKIDGFISQIQGMNYDGPHKSSDLQRSKLTKPKTPNQTQQPNESWHGMANLVN
jgi:hypothetical protein